MYLLYYYIKFAQSIGNNPINLPRADFTLTYTSAIKAIFGIVGLLSVIFVALGGLKYVTSNGDPQGVQKAKNTILYAVIGLVISISAYSIIGFVAGRL